LAPDLLILTEAGGTAGYGHLMRCSAIADAWGSAKILVNELGRFPSRDKLITHLWLNNPRSIFGFINDRTVLLVDSYRADYDVYEEIKSLGNKLVVIDDYDRICYPCDLLVNPGILSPSYKECIADILSGPEYIIIRREVKSVSPKEYINNEINDVFIMLGGADHSKLLTVILDVLVKYHFNINIIIGNDERAEALSLQYNIDSLKLYGRLDASRVAELMCESDLAISAGGQALNELSYLGVPTIAIQTGIDQEFNMKGFVQQGFLPGYLRSNDADIVPGLENLIMKYSSHEKRSMASNLGKKLVDGNGVVRIVEAIQSRLGLINN